VKILIVFGTRPEIIKLAPVIHALKGSFDVKTLHTGQHVELAEDMIEFFRLKPDYNAECVLLAPDMEGIYECVDESITLSIHHENPDLVILQGDTYTAYAAAFAAFMLKKPVLHIEAGLRTNTKFKPFPEEGYRTLISRLTDFHFAPTRRACENLLHEGVRGDRIFIVGNTIVDAIQMVLSNLNEENALRELNDNHFDYNTLSLGKEMVLITAHRRESIGEPLREICRAVKFLSEQFENVLFIWSLHRNQGVREIVLDELRQKKENIVLVEALSYPTMIFLMRATTAILTDSGGIQEEAPALQKPVFILRDVTERPEILKSGLGVLAGTEKNKIIDTFSSFMTHRGPCQTHAIENPFGDGKTSERLLRFLMIDEVRQLIYDYPASADRVLSFNQGRKGDGFF